MNILIDKLVYEYGLAKLEAIPGVNVEIVDTPEEENPRPLPAEMLADVDAMMCSLPPSNLDDMHNLKLIQIVSAGYSQLVKLDLPKQGIRACNALGVFDVPIAEWNIAMMINCLRDLRGMIRNQENGIWDRGVRFQTELRGSTVGFWGYGGIARETARIAKLMGLNVHVLTRSGIKSRENTYCVPFTGDLEGILPDKQFTMEQKMEFLNGIDFLVLALPMTDSSRGIIGESELRAMKPSAYLLNPARGAIIQEQALITALNKGWIAGAALDTHYYYPMPPEHPLWAMPNVIMTPHISGSNGSPYFLPRIYDIFTQNIERLMQNKPLLNELTSEQLSGA